VPVITDVSVLESPENAQEDLRAREKLTDCHVHLAALPSSKTSCAREAPESSRVMR